MILFLNHSKNVDYISIYEETSHLDVQVCLTRPITTEFDIQWLLRSFGLFCYILGTLSKSLYVKKLSIGKMNTCSSNF